MNKMTKRQMAQIKRAKELKKDIEKKLNAVDRYIKDKYYFNDAIDYANVLNDFGNLKKKLLNNADWHIQACENGEVE